jgi:predicted metal-dependent phosphoesterase TrpH
MRAGRLGVAAAHDEAAAVRARPARVPRLLLATAAVAALAATVGASAAPAAEQWYQTDLHRHSVLSADAKGDLGVVAQNMRSLGYDAVFVTDHDRGSDFQISGATANSLTLTDGIGSWQAPRTTGTGSATNEFVTSPVHSGTQSLHLAASSSGLGETMLWKSRGPSLRSGDAIMDFWVDPASIGAGSGVYASASIGGDPTIASPVGYTSTAGVTTIGKSNVLVWQIGGARTASSVADRRVVTQDLPYTLNSWNHYTIDVSTGATSWNGAPVAGTGGGLQSIPEADRADPQNALTYVKLAARSNGTPVDAYVDDFSLTASAPLCPATEFAQRNAQIASYDTPDFALFPAREMGQTRHTQQLNFGIGDARDYEFPGETGLCGATNTASAPFHWHRYGSDSIPDVHASGYPAINNHPGTTDDVPDVIATQGHGADGIEAYNAADFTGVWDSILGQDHPITGSAGTDSHEILGGKAIATYLRSPALTLDDLMRNYYEGRLYVAFTSFGGRMVLSLDGSSEPYPGRYPVYVPASQTSASVSLDVSAGLVAGDTIRWVTNSGSGPTATTVTRSSPSYSETRTIPLSGSFTYARAEVRDAAGTLKAFTQPVFFRRIDGLPSGESYRVDRITTADGRGYTNVGTRGIAASSYDTRAERLSMTLANPAGSRTNVLGTAGAAPRLVTVNGVSVPPALSLFAYETTTGSSWFYDAPSSQLYLQVEQPAASASVAATFAEAGRAAAQAPSPPAGVAATAVGTSQIDLRWSAARDDAGVDGYRVRRDGAIVATVGATATSFSDTALTASTTYSYTVDAYDATGDFSDESAAVSATTQAPPTTTTLGPVADAYVSDSAPTTNFGTATTLRTDASAPVQVGYLRFDVSGLGRAPQKAILRVYANTTHAVGYDVFGVANTTWGESGSGSITFSNAPPLAVAATGSSKATTAGGYTSVDVTPLIAGDGLVSLALRTTSATGLALGSREATPAQRPQLVVTRASADVQSPSVPSAVSATAPSASRIDVTWSASTDDVGVTGYRIRRDGDLLATVAGSVTSFGDSGLAGASTYAYTVEAVDAAGNASAASAPASATTAAASATTTFAAVADAYVDDSKATTSFGTATTLRTDASAPIQLSYLRFDVSGLADAPRRAVLRVYPNSSHAAGYGVFAVPDTTWLERGSGAITYANAPSPAATASGSSGAATAGAYTTVDVTPLVTGNGLVSFALRTTSATGLSLASREASPDKRPELVVTP